MYPKDLRYSTEHEWARLEDRRVRVGITRFAAERLSDVVFIELPAVGSAVTMMQPFGVIESVKAVSDLYAPASGRVAEVNTRLANEPELVNRDPHGNGWMIIIEPQDLHELEKLMTAEQYEKTLGEAQA